MGLSLKLRFILINRKENRYSMYVSNRIEYNLITNIEDYDTEEVTNISLDLTEDASVTNIVGNFQRFLLKIGVPYFIIKEFISFPDENKMEFLNQKLKEYFETNGEDFDEEDELAELEAEINQELQEELNQKYSKRKVEKGRVEELLSDPNAKKKFLEQLSNEEFVDKLFRIFLEEMMEEERE